MSLWTVNQKYKTLLETSLDFETIQCFICKFYAQEKLWFHGIFHGIIADSNLFNKKI